MPSGVKLEEGWCEMATAKPKVKRMMFGGAAGMGASALKSVGAKAAPMRTQSQMQKVDRSTSGPALQKFPDRQGYRQAESVYKQMQQQKQLANTVGRPSSGTVGLGQIRPIAGAAAKALGLGKKKGGAVKKATKK